MNGDVFEHWFEEKLLPNLPEKCIIVLDNASYHSHQVKKIPTMKADMINFMKDHGIRVPEPIPIKAVLLEKIKMANIKKRFVIEMASKKVTKFYVYHLTIAI